MNLFVSAFNTAMDSFSGDVQKLLQGTNNDGVFNLLKTRLDNLDSETGLIHTTLDSLDATSQKYDDLIASQQMRLDIRREALSKTFAAADEAISRLNQLSDSFQSLTNRFF